MKLSPFVSMLWRKGISVMFIGMLLFELLNYLGILSFKVDYTWFGRLFSTVVMFGILQLIDGLFRWKFQTRLQGSVWVLAALLLWSDFIGDIFQFYTRWTWYDQAIHFISGPVVTAALLIALETVREKARWNTPRAVTYVLAVGVNTIFSVLYEIEEYLEDYFFQTNRLGDGPDTVNDLMMSLIGGSLFIGCVAVYRALQRNTLSHQDDHRACREEREKHVSDA